MDDHDVRQLEAMKRQIDAYKRGDIDLPWLISSLEALRNVLQTVPDEWIEPFWAKWGVLEEIYSISVVRRQPIPDAGAAEISQAIEDIESMISSILSPFHIEDPG